MFVAVYLVAVVVSNLILAEYGAVAAIPVGFFLVGLDLVLRDTIHEQWAGKGLWARMLLLIAAGGALSFLVNRDAAIIAVASSAAFVAAGITDTLIYQTLREQSWYKRSNGSNLGSALVDSAVFLTVAFGAFMPLLILTQYIAKVLGGVLWTWLIAEFGPAKWRKARA